MPRSLFVVIDGPNGAGKTSLCRELQSAYRAHNHRPPLLLKQPSDTDLGRLARHAEESMHGWPLATFVIADRYVQTEREITPALVAGQDVICDRYVASTLVLQRLDGLDPELLWLMSSQVLIPDLTVIASAHPDTLRRRLAERGRLSRFERAPLNADREVAYFADAASFLEGQGFRVLRLGTDEAGAVTSNAQYIWQLLEQLRTS